jgi:hypothetical protein
VAAIYPRSRIRGEATVSGGRERALFTLAEELYLGAVRLLLGTGIRLLITVAIVVALASVPLLVVYRSTCREDRKDETRWSFVAPWDDPENGDCRRHQNGFEVLADELGLED